MATTTNLGLTTYTTSGDSTVPFGTFIDTMSSNMDKIDDAVVELDTTLSVSGAAADAGAVNTKKANYMLKSVYDPQGKSTDMYTALEEQESGSSSLVCNIYLQCETDCAGDSYTIVRVSDSTTVQSGTIPSDGLINFKTSEAGVEYTLKFSHTETKSYLESPTAVDYHFLSGTELYIGDNVYISSTYTQCYYGTSEIEVVRIPTYNVGSFGGTDWSVISEIAQKGVGSNYFYIGASKTVVLSSAWYYMGTSESTRTGTGMTAFIIAFTHTNGVLGALIDGAINGIYIALRTSYLIYVSNVPVYFYASGPASYTTTSSQGEFTMHTTNRNAGGWESCQARTYLYGQDKSTTTTTTLMYCLPSELRNVLRTHPNYTENTAGGASSASITATTDYIWLGSEYEMLGTSAKAYAVEATYQSMYTYWGNGNSVKGLYSKGVDAGSYTNAEIWTRSPYRGNNNGWVTCYPSSTTYSATNVTYSSNDRYCNRQYAVIPIMLV